MNTNPSLEFTLAALDKVLISDTYYPKGFFRFKSSINRIKDFLLFRNNATLEDAYYELIKAFNCSKKFYEEQKMPYYQECVLEISMYFYQRLNLSHFLRSQNEIDSNIMLAILLNAKNHFVNKNYEPKRNV